MQNPGDYRPELVGRDPLARFRRQDGDPGMMTPKRVRPFGVALIAAHYFLTILFLVYAIANVWSHTWKSDSGYGSSYLDFGSAGYYTVDNPPLFAAICTLEAAVSAVVGIGLWKLQEWSRSVAIGFFGLQLVVLVWTNLGNAISGMILLEILVALGGIFYLRQESVQNSFKEL